MTANPAAAGPDTRPALVALRSRAGTALIAAVGVDRISDHRGLAAAARRGAGRSLRAADDPGRRAGRDADRLGSRPFDAINAATVLFYGALGAVSYLVILQCELQLGYSATKAGAALIPESAVFLIVSPLVGGVVARFGTRWPMAVGILVVAAGFGWLSRARPGESYAAAILPGAILWGLGVGLAGLLAGVTVAAGVLTAVFVPSRRVTAPHLAPAPRLNACAVAEPAA